MQDEEEEELSFDFLAFEWETCEKRGFRCDKSLLRTLPLILACFSSCSSFAIKQVASGGGGKRKGGGGG